MGSSHTRKFFITHHDMEAGRIRRKAAKQEARQTRYDEKKAQADRDQLMRLGFCLLWFIGVVMIIAYYDIIMRVLM